MKKKIEFILKESIQFHKIEFILNVSFEETLSTIFILVTYQKIKFILKVSLEEKPLNINLIL